MLAVSVPGRQSVGRWTMSLPNRPTLEPQAEQRDGHSNGGRHDGAYFAPDPSVSRGYQAAHRGRSGGSGGSCRCGRPRGAVSLRSIRRRARRAAAEPAGSRRTRRRRCQRVRRGRCLLRARPRLRLHRHGVRDAPDHGGDPGAPCLRQRLASPDAAAPERRAMVARFLHHGGNRRRRPARQRLRGSPRRRAHVVRKECDRDVLRRRGRCDPDHRAPLARCRPLGSGAGGAPQK